MNRITDRNLQAVVDRINKLTGSPLHAWETIDGRNVAQVGNFHLSYANGGVCLHRMHNEHGGVSTPLRTYHGTRRELYDSMHAFITGLNFAKENP